MASTSKVSCLPPQSGTNSDCPATVGVAETSPDVVNTHLVLSLPASAVLTVDEAGA